jgi:hypothetical protein|tara:strand:- start:171 stop:422 length:252 start_codon:yes stop_codon:yes gene_type:complete
MKTNFKMKEAINKEEAIVSILDVLEENPLWLNKVNQSIHILLATNLENRKWILNECEDDIVIALFIDMKTEYYNYKDFTQYNY